MHELQLGCVRVLRSPKWIDMARLAVRPVMEVGGLVIHSADEISRKPRKCKEGFTCCTDISMFLTCCTACKYRCFDKQTWHIICSTSVRIIAYLRHKL